MAIDRPHLGFELTIESGDHYEIVMGPNDLYYYAVDNLAEVIHSAGPFKTTADAFRACRSWMREHQNEVFK